MIKKQKNTLITPRKDQPKFFMFSLIFPGCTDDRIQVSPALSSPDVHQHGPCGTEPEFLFNG